MHCEPSQEKLPEKSESLAREERRGLLGSQPSSWCSLNKNNMPGITVMRSLISQGVGRVRLAYSQQPSICQGENG